MEDYCDGELFSVHPLFSAHSNALQVQHNLVTCIRVLLACCVQCVAVLYELMTIAYRYFSTMTMWRFATLLAPKPKSTSLVSSLSVCVQCTCVHVYMYTCMCSVCLFKVLVHVYTCMYMYVLATLALASLADVFLVSRYVLLHTRKYLPQVPVKVVFH